MYSSHPELKRARFQIFGSSDASIFFNLASTLYTPRSFDLEPWYHPNLWQRRNTATDTATAPQPKNALERQVKRPRQPSLYFDRSLASKMASQLTQYIFQPHRRYSKPESSHAQCCSSEIIFVARDCLSSESSVGGYSQLVSRSDWLHISE